MRQTTILIVDDEPSTLQLFRQMLKDDYQLKFARNGVDGLAAAQRFRPDLILLDVDMPDLDGYTVCRKLKEIPATQSIPVIFVTASNDESSESKGFQSGAVDYIYKPLSPTVTRHRISTHLSLVNARELEKSQEAAIYMLGTAGHFSDNDTGVHIWRMADYAQALAKAAGWSQADAGQLRLAAAMHDTGKIGIPDAIMGAPRVLTPTERKIMENHTVIGAAILSKSDTPLFTLAAEVARSHHERWDGTGYPDGLAKNAIPESARIVAIADVFDALTTKRPYKQAWIVDEAIAKLKNDSGTHFDARLVALFEQNLERILTIKKQWSIKSVDLENRSTLGQAGSRVVAHSASNGRFGKSSEQNRQAEQGSYHTQQIAATQV